MKKALLIFTLFSAYVFSQVGINTSTPKAMLDVEGNVRVGITNTLTTKPEYVLTLDENQVLKKILTNSLAAPEDIYAPKLVGLYTLKERIICNNCGTRIINFKGSDLLDDKNLRFNSDGGFTVLTGGLYYFSFTVVYSYGVNSDDVVLGILNDASPKKWIGRATFSVNNNRESYVVYNTSLSLSEGQVFYPAIATNNSITVYEKRTSPEGVENITNLSIVKY